MGVGDRDAVNAGDLDAIWALSEAWLPTVEKAREQLNTKGIPRPAGVTGVFSLNYNVRVDGTVVWMLNYRGSKTGSSTTQVGKFCTNFLPDEPKRKPLKPLATNGRDMISSDGLHRRVRIDAAGLPRMVLVLQGAHREVEYPPDLYMPNDDL